MSLPVNTRRYDLDWLRVIAFSLLIIYHMGMFYVTWSWHVKSQYMSDSLEPMMLVLNPWRLALLFFISGVAIRFATDKASSRKSFATSRLSRLGLPILAGVFVIVMPQTYFQLLQAGIIDPGIVKFYPKYLLGGADFPVITPTWNHLWYIVYLLVYILIVVALLPSLQTIANGKAYRLFRWLADSRSRLLFLVPIPFIIVAFTLSQWYPTTYALVGDWGTHGHRFTMFMIGYFVAKHPEFWRGVDRTLPVSTVLFLVLCPIWIFAPVPQFLAPVASELYSVIEIIYAWVCMTTLLGWAQRKINIDSPLLRYLTAAVFCYYILHQTIIVVVGYWITPYSLGFGLEFLALFTITILGCWLGYELFKRVSWMRRFFGIA